MEKEKKPEKIILLTQYCNSHRIVSTVHDYILSFVISMCAWEALFPEFQCLWHLDDDAGKLNSTLFTISFYWDTSHMFRHNMTKTFTKLFYEDFESKVVFYSIV